MPQDKTSGKKLADMLYGDNRPAFGVYPMIAKRREDRQDREAAKNFPVDLTRGAVAGAAGMPGDIESLARLPYTLYTGNESPTALPTSEEILKRLPFGSDTPTGRFASGLGTLAGGSAPFGAIPMAVKAGAKGAMAAGRAGERMAEKYVPQIMERGGAGADILTGLTQGSRSQIFIGPKAKTFDAAKAALAEKMEQAGADPVDIWRTTGTFRGADGILRQEISDANAIYRKPDELEDLGKEKKAQAEALKQRLVTPKDQKDLFPKALTEAKKPAREEVKRLKEEASLLARDPVTRGQPAKFVYEHPELYKAYPELADVQIYQGGRGTMGEQASVRGTGADTQLDVTLRGLAGNPQSSVLHEMQHAVQGMEGMAPGGNTVTALQNPEALKILGDLRLKANTPMSFEDFVKKGGYGDDEETLARAAEEYKDYADDVPVLAKKYDRDLQSQAAMEYYKRLAGEAEARASQAREPMGMAERMQEFPYSSYDVLPEDLIVKPAREYAAGGLAKALKAGVKALKGTQEVLPAAEREANLQKFLKPSKTPMRLYHGTTASEDGKGQEAIRRIKPSKEGALGSGAYLTPKADFAGSYAEQAGGNVLPVHAQIKSPLVLEGKGDPMIEALTKLGMEEDKAIRMVERAYEEKGYIGKQVENRARAMGYDGLMQYRDGQLSEVVSYNPNAIKSAMGNAGSYDITSPDLSKAKGGSVHFSDNPDTMALELAGGGLVAKLAKLARAPAKSKAEINALAERIAPQVTGEYVRESAKSAKTVAGKTQKQFQREKTLPVDVRMTEGAERIPEKVDIEQLKDSVVIGIPGDPTLTGKTLYSVGDDVLDSPAPQHGGPLYGLYNDDFWASGLGAARGVQNLAKRAGEQYDAPVKGMYIMMGPDSINYAQHFADANLQAIDLSRMSKGQIETFNKLIRQGSPKSGPRVSFPGIEDKGEAYLHMAMDPELRKHFNALMQQNTITQKLNLPNGNDIRFAITEPALRDLETGVTGFSMGRMRPDIPSEALQRSTHPTYDYDVPGEFMGQSKYPMPYELTFADSVKAIRENPAQAPHEFGSLKMSGARQTIDQQMIDEIRAYEERMKQLTGKKKGGAVKKAAGGEITADDLILEERKL